MQSQKISELLFHVVNLYYTEIKRVKLFLYQHKWSKILASITIPL